MRPWTAADGGFALAVSDGDERHVDIDAKGTHHVVVRGGKEVRRAQVAVSAEEQARRDLLSADAAASVAEETASTDLATKLRNKLDNLRTSKALFVAGGVTTAQRDAAIKLLLGTAILGVRVLIRVALGKLPAADAADET